MRAFVLQAAVTEAPELLRCHQKASLGRRVRGSAAFFAHRRVTDSGSAPLLSHKHSGTLCGERRLVATMAWRSHGQTNEQLVDALVRNHIITSPRVQDAMRHVDRGKYCPQGTSPYMDAPQPVGYNATISAPHMHASCLELLVEQLQPGKRALDVGHGSGYLVACMAHMLGEQGKAFGIEHIPELTQESIKNIRSDHPEYLSSGRVTLTTGDGRQGIPEHAPYDAIHVGAATPSIPAPLIDQLAINGRMILPVGGPFHQELVQVDKQADGSVETKSVMGVIYVPLTERSDQWPVR
ncbi:Protein-L-isoaspartate(D-aspartate) O-methyltransferase [Porphyridium purpureum]|uniref:protein-L-isoaspartate(D-aspartate) O-methyltransferase n=1 Tax=Porphyridium purpureum TaxID=35688 RepID=A0A5J4YMW0_PORPP|nr:Protein-L-isoaspartate(D-aspartate) O-methyltransferase [Porphyridium purpureum]|eukprot:POR8685..scf295_9